MAAKLGLAVPTLIQFEREIDEDELRVARSERLGSWRASASPDSGRSGSCDSAVDVDGEGEGEGDELASSCSMSTDSATSSASTPQHAKASLKNVDQVVSTKGEQITDGL